VNLTQKIAVAAGALTLTATGIAAAGSPPEAADSGLTTAEEQVGVELPATKDAHPGAPDAPGTTEEAEIEVEDAGLGPVDNHGAEVSVVAQSDATAGREHGEAVSAVARDNHGAEQQAANATLGADNAGEHGQP
jgi:hypothetical protein